MNKKIVLENIAVLMGIILYNILFWQEGLGINVLIFTLFIMLVLYAFNPEARQSPQALWTTLGTFILAGFIVWHNSLMSKVLYMLSFVTAVGFIKESALKFIFYSFNMTFAQIVKTPFTAFQKLITQFDDLNVIWLRFRYARLAIIPCLILFVFFGIYYHANSQFAAWSDNFSDFIGGFFSFDVSIERLLFLFFGLLIVGGIIWKEKDQIFTLIQNRKKEDLERTRERKKGKAFYTPVDLKNEYRIAMILIIALNGLLFVVNISDISYVWFNYEGYSAVELKAFVHQGTYLLILAILLAMGILVYYFRKNINFLSFNRPLKIGAYIWIAQNVLLALSVAARNFRYVEHHALAYKRIGVFIFVTLVIYGLWTMFLKVKNKKTFYHLLYKNSWAIYIVLILASAVNWDGFITHYNLKIHKGEYVDADFLIHDVSDKNLYYLLENKTLLKQKSGKNMHWIEHNLNQKVDDFEHRTQRHSFFSWNYADYKNQRYLHH